MPAERHRRARPVKARGAAADAARRPRSDQGGAGAPPYREPSRTAGGLATALSERTADSARPGPADGRDCLRFTGTGAGRAQTRTAAPAAQDRRAGKPGRRTDDQHRSLSQTGYEAVAGMAGAHP